MINIEKKEDYLFHWVIDKQCDFSCYIKNITDIKERIKERQSISDEISGILEKCKSPIERLLCLICLLNCPEIRTTNIFPQHKIGNYFVDILIKNAGGKFFAFEADGHDFHEKTKEQAQHDKERDRFISLQGIKVYRFTGSEIFSHTLDIIIEVMDIIGNEYYGECNE